MTTSQGSLPREQHAMASRFVRHDHCCRPFASPSGRQSPREVGAGPDLIILASNQDEVRAGTFDADGRGFHVLIEPQEAPTVELAVRGGIAVRLPARVEGNEREPRSLMC